MGKVGMVSNKYLSVHNFFYGIFGHPLLIKRKKRVTKGIKNIPISVSSIQDIIPVLFFNEKGYAMYRIYT